MANNCIDHVGFMEVKKVPNLHLIRDIYNSLTYLLRGLKDRVLFVALEGREELRLGEILLLGELLLVGVE